MDLKAYEIGKILGSGNFGVVHEGKCRSSGKSVALKFIPRAKVDTNVKREILNMSRTTSHPAVITLLDLALTEDKNHIVLILQKAAGGELFSLVAARGKLSEEEGARGYLQQIVLGVEHLHNSGIFHRDLKLENILLSEDLTRCFIADLGYSKSSYDSNPHSTVGTPAYIAPEVLARVQYDGRRVDVWSIGVILYVMLTGRYPFEDPVAPRNMRKTMQRIVEFAYVLPTTLSPAAADLIRRIFTSADKRISIVDIKCHPFFLPGIEQAQHLLASCAVDQAVTMTAEAIDSILTQCFQV